MFLDSQVKQYVSLIAHDQGQEQKSYFLCADHVACMFFLSVADLYNSSEHSIAHTTVESILYCETYTGAFFQKPTSHCKEFAFLIYT